MYLYTHKYRVEDYYKERKETREIVQVLVLLTFNPESIPRTTEGS